MSIHKTLLLARDLDEFLTDVDGSPAVFVNACGDRHVMVPEEEFRRLKILAGDAALDETGEPRPVSFAEQGAPHVPCSTPDILAFAREIAEATLPGRDEDCMQREIEVAEQQRVICNQDTELAPST